MCTCFSESIISFAEVASCQHQHQYCLLNAGHFLNAMDLNFFQLSWIPREHFAIKDAISFITSV
jgi:hypothetical protein